MKSLLSLLLMLMVIAVVLAGGYWLYTQSGGHPLGATGEGTTLSLQNYTSSALTVEMKGPLLVRFSIMPGKTQTRSIAPGTYDVRGTTSDPTTSGFGGSWTFDAGHHYNAGFTSSKHGGASQLESGSIRAEQAHT